MKNLLWIVLILMGTSVTASPIATWSGAGPHACMGKCPQDWAESQLTETELEELRAAQAEDPEPYFIPIEDGDVFDMVTYFKDGEPVAYRTHTVAVLSSPTGSVGWHMDGWSFVKLDECQNWTVVRHTDLYGAATGITSRPNIPHLFTYNPPPHQPIPWPTDDPHDPWPPITWDPPDYPDPWKPKPPVDDPNVVVTPLPAGIALLITALGGLVLLKRRES